MTPTKKAADRLEALTAPVEGMTLETTAEQRAHIVYEQSEGSAYHNEDSAELLALLRDHDRLSSALAAERDECRHWYAAYSHEYANRTLEMASLAAERERNERLAEALTEIDQWSQAYPLSVFPEPDFAKATEVLKAAGMTLDAISASNMRHVVEGVGKIARAALSQEKQP